jgi:hypothetical protein
MNTGPIVPTDEKKDRNSFALDEKTFAFLKAKNAEVLQIQSQINGALQLISIQENLQDNWTLDWNTGLLMKDQRQAPQVAPPVAPPQKTNGVDTATRA